MRCRSGRLGNLSTSLWGMIERVCLVYFTTWLDFAVGDLPVHCLLQDLSGHWTLHLTEAKSDAVEHGGKFCLHQAPNKNQENLDILKLSKAEWEAEFGGGGASVRQLQVSLTEEQSLIARQPQEHDAADGNAAHWHDLLVTDAQTGKVKGSWTPVYDEGMEIHLSEVDSGAYSSSAAAAFGEMSTSGGASSISSSTSTSLRLFAFSAYSCASAGGESSSAFEDGIEEYGAAISDVASHIGGTLESLLPGGSSSSSSTSFLEGSHVVLADERERGQDREHHDAAGRIGYEVDDQAVMLHDRDRPGALHVDSGPLVEDAGKTTGPSLASTTRASSSSSGSSSSLLQEHELQRGSRRGHDEKSRRAGHSSPAAAARRSRKPPKNALMALFEKSQQQCGKKGDLINSDGTLPPGYASLCGQTNVGWYKDMKSGKFGCWWGEKTEAGERKLVSSFVMLRDKERKRDFQHHPSRRIFRTTMAGAGRSALPQLLAKHYLSSGKNSATTTSKGAVSASSASTSSTNSRLASTAGAGVSLSASLGTASTKRNKADDIFSNVADAEHRFYEAATALLFGEQQQDVETAGGTGAVGGGRSTKIGGQQNELAAAEGGEDQHQERSSTTSEAAGTSTTAVEQDLQMADLRAAAAQKFGAAVQQHLDRVHESSSPHPSITTRSHTSSKTEACNLDRRTENLQLYRNMTQMAKNFDWREQFHNKWNTDVIEQGNCGSCYVIAATYALQSRYNLRLLQAGVELSEVGGDEDDAGDADEDSAGAFSAMSSIYDDLLGGAKELLPAALAETTEAGKETKSTDEIGEKRTSTEKNLVRREQSIEKAEDVQLRNKSADPETEISILQHGQEEATSTRSAKAVTRAASGRAKKTKKFILPYEVPLYCSFYNQDCDGGYPELVARHLSEFGTPEKRNVPSTSENDIDCASLLGGGSSSSAASSSSFLSSEEEHGTAEVSTAKASSRHRAGAKANSNLAYAKDYGYVGGFYGKCSEARMMHEIYHHGPVPVAVDAGSGNFEQYVAEQVAGGHHLMAPDQALVEVEYVADAELDEGVRTLVENSTSTSAPGPGAGTTTKLSVVSTAASSVAGENRRRRTTLSLPAPSISETADEPLTPKALLALVEGLSFSPPTADADSTEQDPPSAAAASLSFEDQMRERGRGSTVDATVTQKSEHAVQAALRTVRDAIHALEMAEQSGGTGTDEEGKNVLHITKVTENSINAWEYVDHAVVAVGWGETNTHPPRKYWIIRNSWGPKWGSEHSGYGYLPRGENDIGIWWDQVVSG
eukprot:CAMPEP_0179002334 /NCGR_PEP_ID=MMETSP0795-20121207/11942_1 /TAXON_ID=88552 /ORGANISM="Amoebophrya sp., Strain Ameob2" /LENGTH=1281 /DNA_ID=CAMNT_0020695975 /DNA_START=88 /DNA_END=3933 /DNA_ORIENTATION=-